jgi:hypothetical protein
MDSQELRRLAEDNLGHILQRASQNGGRIESADAAAAQLFCRVVEAETNGGAYGITTYLNGANREAVLARAAAAVPTA